jgi:xanthine dehydrogenase accessory factor
VEEDVAERAAQVCRDGSPALLHYRPVSDPVFEVGLNCDGEIWVLLEPADAHLLTTLARTEPGALVTRYDPHTRKIARRRISDAAGRGPQTAALAGAADLPGGQEFLAAELVHEARAAEAPRSSRSETGEVLLVEPVMPPPEVVVFGATEVASYVARFAREVGFRVVVTDPRANYAAAEYHPDADVVIAGWPEEVFRQVGLSDRSYIVSLNHEPRFEDALFAALLNHRFEPAYVGAIGKRSRHHDRLERALEAGLDIEKLPRIHTPIGLDIGGKSPSEVALSIVSELVAARYRRSGGSHLERYEETGRVDRSRDTWTPDEIRLRTVEPRFGSGSGRG